MHDMTKERQEKERQEGEEKETNIDWIVSTIILTMTLHFTTVDYPAYLTYQA